MLGVLGGMGPAATTDWMAKLVRATPAQRDQDHIPLLLYSDAQTPDRTEAILSGGSDPAPAMLDGVRRLEAGGAQVIAIPCNTAHHWHGMLQRSTRVPILHIVDGVADTLDRRGAKGAVGILATTATVRSGFYGRRLRRTDRTCLYPSSEHQAAVMQSIRLVKAGDAAQARAGLQAAIAHLSARGAETIVLACTELPLALPIEDKPFLIDAGVSLVQLCLRWWIARSPPRETVDGPDLDRGFPGACRHPQLLQGGGSAPRDPTGV